MQYPARGKNTCPAAQQLKLQFNERRDINQMSQKQFLTIAAIALIALGVGISRLSTASASVETMSGLESGINSPAPAPTPKKRQFPTGSTDTVQQPAGLKG